jgi:hypothetical protein
MSRKGHSAEAIIGKLREAEVLLAQGQSVAQARRSGSRSGATTAGVRSTEASSSTKHAG